MVESIILTHAAVLEINPRPSWHTFWLQDWWSIATLLKFHYNFTKSQHISWSQGQKITDASPNPPAKKTTATTKTNRPYGKHHPFRFPFPGKAVSCLPGFPPWTKLKKWWCRSKTNLKVQNASFCFLVEPTTNHWTKQVYINICQTKLDRLFFWLKQGSGAKIQK